MVAIIVNLVVNTVFKALVMRLLVFHAWLRSKGLTTYQYLIELRERRENQKRISKVIKKIEKPQLDIEISNSSNTLG
jgi:hypothetical protein